MAVKLSLYKQDVEYDRLDNFVSGDHFKRLIDFAFSTAYVKSGTTLQELYRSHVFYNRLHQNTYYGASTKVYKLSENIVNHPHGRRTFLSTIRMIQSPVFSKGYHTKVKPVYDPISGINPYIMKMPRFRQARTRIYQFADVLETYLNLTGM